MIRFWLGIDLDRVWLMSHAYTGIRLIHAANTTQTANILPGVLIHLILLTLTLPGAEDVVIFGEIDSTNCSCCELER